MSGPQTFSPKPVGKQGTGFFYILGIAGIVMITMIVYTIRPSNDSSIDRIINIQNNDNNPSFGLQQVTAKLQDKLPQLSQIPQMQQNPQGSNKIDNQNTKKDKKIIMTQQNIENIENMKNIKNIENTRDNNKENQNIEKNVKTIANDELEPKKTQNVINKPETQNNNEYVAKKYLLFGTCEDDDTFTVKRGTILINYISWVNRFSELEPTWIVKIITINKFAKNSWNDWENYIRYNDSLFSFIENHEKDKIQWIINYKCATQHKWYDSAYSHFLNKLAKMKKENSDLVKLKIDTFKSLIFPISQTNLIDKIDSNKHGMDAFDMTTYFHNDDKNNNNKQTIDWKTASNDEKFDKLTVDLLNWLNRHIFIYEDSFNNNGNNNNNNHNDDYLGFSNFTDTQDAINLQKYSNFYSNQRYFDMWQNETYFSSHYHYSTFKYGRPLIIAETDEVFDEFSSSIWQPSNEILDIIVPQLIHNLGANYILPDNNEPTLKTYNSPYYKNFFNKIESYFNQHSDSIKSKIDNNLLLLWDNVNRKKLNANDDVTLLDAIFHVFNRINKQECRHRADIQFVRQKEWPHSGCILLHQMQGVGQYDMMLNNAWNILAKFIELRDFHRLKWPSNEESMEKNAIYHYNKNEIENLSIQHKKTKIQEYIDYTVENRMHNHTRFCAFAVKGFFMGTHYAPDGLVRQAFQRLLNETYKHCDMLGWHDQWTPQTINCNRQKYTPYGLPICESKYKFTISMENSFSHGYVTEKLFSGLFAGSMPIYFGATDISRYINIDRIIHCDINEININRMRLMYTLLKRNEFMNHSDNELLQFAISYLKNDLLKCIEKVKQVDMNDTLYKWKLSQPVFPNNKMKNTYYDHTTIAQNVINLLKLQDSPLFDE